MRTEISLILGSSNPNQQNRCVQILNPYISETMKYGVLEIFFFKSHRRDVPVSKIYYFVHFHHLFLQSYNKDFSSIFYVIYRLRFIHNFTRWKVNEDSCEQVRSFVYRKNVTLYVDPIHRLST